MDIKDFEVKIKKYDEAKNVVIANVILPDILELRGFTVRYTTTKHSPTVPVWLASPPSVLGRNKKYFWIVRFLDSALWQQLQRKIVTYAKEYTDKPQLLYSITVTLLVII